MKIERLGAVHYDEIVTLLNRVFSKKNGREMNFERELPNMCVRDDAHMGCHFGIFDGGRLSAVMGVYPYAVKVGDATLRFATAGNIAVDPAYEGRGYMSALLDTAMAELERLDIDVARLGGLRSRYNRYGFEACGQKYTFTLTEKNRERKFPDDRGDISFAEIAPQDKDALAFALSLYRKNAVCVLRTMEKIYGCLTAWQNTPYLAVRNGLPIGYLCANQSGTVIAECDATDAATLGEMLCAWQERTGASISFTRQPHQVASVRLFTERCESFNLSTPSHFKICDFERVIDAFLKLKASFLPLPEGEICMEISGYGTLSLFVREGEVGCHRCEGEPAVTLDPVSAARYLFGPYAPMYTACVPSVAAAWLPLPLGWSTLDRV